MKAWRVYGESENRDWTLAVYKEFLPADTHLELAKRHADAHGYSYPNPHYVTNPKPNPYDPQMLDAFGGVSYRVEEVDLK